MVNWRELGVPFENFTEEITCEWIWQGFSREECKEWLDVGLKAKDAEFCAWLRDEKKLTKSEILDCDSKEELRKEYNDHTWKKIIDLYKNNYEESFSLNNWLLEKVKDLEHVKIELHSLQLQYADLPKIKWFMSNSKKQTLVDDSNFLQQKIEEHSIKVEQLTNEKDMIVERICKLEEWTYVMEGKVISEETIEKIKDFDHKNLTFEQRLLLVNNLIPFEGLRKRFEEYGLCSGCQQPKTDYNWCQFCQAQYFRQSFPNWTSGNQKIDEFIQESQLKAISSNRFLLWIPYEQFTEIEHLANGGFSRVCKAKWSTEWVSNGEVNVALKILNSSKDITDDFLKEILYYKHGSRGFGIVRCYGISQEPETKDYIMVMSYAEGGDLRTNLDKFNFEEKLVQLYLVANGLNTIHQLELVHRDLHPGNILINHSNSCSIADLGLCRPVNEVNETDKGKVYGVLPYMAPEVLRGNSHTQASDIYSFSIIMYEYLTGLLPYYEHAHEEFLALKICQGLRPNLNKIKLPKLLEELIERCWDADPKKRPVAGKYELEETLSAWLDYSRATEGKILVKKDTEFYSQYKKTEEINKKRQELEFFEAFRKLFLIPINDVPSDNKFLPCQIHPQAVYASHLLNFKNLSEPQNSKEINEIFYKLSDELEDLRITDPVKFSEELERKFESLKIKGKSLEIFRQNNSSDSVHELESKKITPIEIPKQITWTTLPNFTSERIQQWINRSFTPSQTRDWLNIGLQPTDSHFASWFRDELHLEPLEVLNNINVENNYQEADLREQFQEFQTQIQQSPK